MAADKIDTIVSLSKRRGFVFPSGEIYGGTRSAWDYGPLGVELKENIKRQWWRSMVTGRDDVVGLDSLGDPAPRGVGGLRPRRDVHRPADRVPVLPQALPRRPPARRTYEAQARQAGRRATTSPRSPAPTAAPRGACTEPRQFNMMLKTYLGAGRGRGGPGLPAPRDRAGHLRQLRATCRPPRARSRRSASPRSARASATRSRPATSSSAPASSSRWRWSSSSSPARTRSGTSTGSTSARAGTPTSASQPRTCATSSTRRRSSPTTPSAPSTSSTASASAAASGASSRASPTAPTST